MKQLYLLAAAANILCYWGFAAFAVFATLSGAEKDLALALLFGGVLFCLGALNGALLLSNMPAGKAEVTLLSLRALAKPAAKGRRQ